MISLDIFPLYGIGYLLKGVSFRKKMNMNDGTPFVKGLISAVTGLVRTAASAVRTCLVDRYVDISGRASRAEFWTFEVFRTIVSILCLGNVLPVLAGSPAGVVPWVAVALFAAPLALIPPTISVGMRRFRDAGLLPGLYPVIWFMVVYLSSAKAGTARSFICLIAVLALVIAAAMPSRQPAEKSA